MKAPDGWPTAARMSGIRSHERRSTDAHRGGKEEYERPAHPAGPEERRSDAAVRAEAAAGEETKG